MKPKTLTDVLEALNHYKSHFRRDGLVPLEFSGLQARFPELESAPEVTSKWPEAWPFGNRQGVYFVFGSQARLLYIGKASMRHPVGARLSSWFQYAKPSGGCKVVHNGWSEPYPLCRSRHNDRYAEIGIRVIFCSTRECRV